MVSRELWDALYAAERTTREAMPEAGSPDGDLHAWFEAREEVDRLRRRIEKAVCETMTPAFEKENA